MKASSPYQEILGVLQAGLECAQSLKSTSVEVEKLIEAGEMDQVQARYEARDEVLTMMINLDQRLIEMMSSARPALSGKEWGHLVTLGGKMRDVLSEATHLDGMNKQKIEAEFKNITGELSRLRQGRQAVHSYQSPQRSNAQFKA